MKQINFSFKWEPLWMLIIGSLAPAALGLLVVMLFLVLKSLRLL